MRILNCKECGKLFQYDGISKLCFQCRRADEEDFRKVKDYLYEFPKETVTTVAIETEVPEEKILRYLREGKLEISAESGILLECESCGEGIRSGRYCDKCAMELDRGLRSGLEDRASEATERRKSSLRMHTR